MKTIITVILLSFSLSSVFDISHYPAVNIENKKDITNIEINENNDILKALLYSSIIPGSGQVFVNDSPIKGAIFFGVELMAWAGYYYYKDKADGYKQDYWNYGYEHWAFDTWTSNYYSPIFGYPNNNPESEFFDLFSNDGEFTDIWEGSHHIEFSYVDDTGNTKMMSPVRNDRIV